MSRSFLLILLAVDLLVMAGASFILWDRVQKKNALSDNLAPAPAAAPIVPEVTQPLAVETQTAISTEPAKPEPLALEAKPAAPKAPPRRVPFRYRDVVPKRVSVIGEFNSWSPQLMKKDAYGNWTVAISIPPGEYAYNFIVDGKMIRDPNNKKVKKSSRKIPSSVLVVPDKPARKTR